MCGLQSSKKVVSKLSNSNAPLGYALCFLNLGLDGFTNATQDAITKKYISSSFLLSILSMCGYLIAICKFGQRHNLYYGDVGLNCILH
jgi:hypothetical protein